MKKRRAYRATSVKRIDLDRVLSGREGQALRAGCDVSKEEVFLVLRWGEEDFERPWKAKNPGEIRELVELLARVDRHRELVVAMEPTGTYGDPFRQALCDVGLVTHRVSPKAAHDYAEVFDGVPSQHDGKDAAVVSELSALGKSWEWSYEPASEVDQQMAYWVDWVDAQRETLNVWYGRLEGLLARHWPEATRTLKLSSGTLLRCLAHYGGPGGVVADQGAGRRLRSWAGHYLNGQKIEQLLADARSSVGVRQGATDVMRMRQYAEKALESRKEMARSKQQLQRLASDNVVIQAQAVAVGVVTACVLWVHLGDPCEYHCGAAYRKAMGLNLKERSSGKWKGRLKITKRGSSQVRRWLYYAALRLAQQEPVKTWYEKKKAKENSNAGFALVGVMRKLPLALYQVGACGAKFDVRLLFPGCEPKIRRKAA